MGIEDRDWYQPAPPPKRGYRSLFLVVAIFVLLLGAVGLKLSGKSVYSGEEQSRAGAVKLTILPGLLSLTLKDGGSLYPKNDIWAGYLADDKTCPGGEQTDLPLDQQANIMVCLINYARQERGLSTLSISTLLNNTSLLKAGKIVRCDDFAHDACGDAPEADARAAGYEGAWGENLYVGEGRLGAPRVALDGWLNSPEHRENLFDPEWHCDGIAVMQVPKLAKYHDATLWVNEFATN